MIYQAQRDRLRDHPAPGRGKIPSLANTNTPLVTVALNKTRLKPTGAGVGMSAVSGVCAWALSKIYPAQEAISGTLVELTGCRWPQNWFRSSTKASV